MDFSLTESTMLTRRNLLTCDALLSNTICLPEIKCQLLDTYSTMAHMNDRHMSSIRPINLVERPQYLNKFIAMFPIDCNLTRNLNRLKNGPAH